MCACPPGSRTVSTKPKGVPGAKPRGPGVVCITQVDGAPRFVKMQRNGRCPSGARRISTPSGPRCLGRARGPRFVAPECE